MKPELKICGLNDAENIRAVVKLRPDFIGFVFFDGSSRNAKGKIIHELAISVPAEIRKVGVFVNDSIDRIINYIGMYNLDYVQLHGTEDPAYCRELENYCGIIKAFGVDEDFDFERTRPYEACCDKFLFDTKTPAHGGSGRAFNWEVLDRYKGSVPFFLSGGIGTENIEEIFMKKMHPLLFALDVNSKAEISPGIKDIHKLIIIKNRLNNEIRNRQ